MPEETSSALKAGTKLELAKEIKLPTIVLAADADPAGARLFAACFDGVVYEVNAATGEHRALGRHDSYASGVCFMPGTEILLSAGYDGKLCWIDPANARTVRTVQAHQFWSWQMDVSPNQEFVASCTGQYLAGGYKYEPAKGNEPGVKIFDAKTGAQIRAWEQLPPVLSLAWSPDSKFLAAASMMGEIKVWDVVANKLVSNWTTPDFTSWGIIKSHHYIGGIYDLAFSPDGDELFACGMGPMSDPMAGNGHQLWQRFDWKEKKKTGQIKDDERGNGLMETLRFHPSNSAFVMAGRLAQGKWNAAIFGTAGSLIHSIDNKMRVTDSVFLGRGDRLLLAGGTSQEPRKDGKCPDFGRLQIYALKS